MDRNKIIRTSMLVLSVFYSINFPVAYGGHGHHNVRRNVVVRHNVVKIIEVQKVQQFVAIPVNPYYFSYNNLCNISSHSAAFTNYGIQPIPQQPILPYPYPQQPVPQQPYPQQPVPQQPSQPLPPGTNYQTTPASANAVSGNDDRYVTKTEFRDFANKVFRALDIPEEVPPVIPPPQQPAPQQPAPQPTDPNQAPSLAEIVDILQRNHCAQCHTGPNSKGDFPIFLNGQIADNLNWDRIATKCLTQSMPPRDSGHTPVPTQEAFRISLFADGVQE